jgi:DNA modification methylase
VTLKCFRCGTWDGERCGCADGSLFNGDCLDVLRMLPAESVNCCVTSPPYWGLRDYGVPGQLGLEKTPDEFVDRLVAVFREVRRVLRSDGTAWLNLGDSYAAHEGQRKPSDAAGSPKQLSNAGSVQCGSRSAAGLKPKDLVGIPWRVAMALQEDGWYLRQDIIWHKPNPMPESVTDRCTKAHEYIFLLAKSERYYFNQDAILEDSVWKPGDRPDVPRGGFNGKHDQPNSQTNGSFRAMRESRNKRSVWTVTTKPYKAAHFATFPPGLIKPCILAGCPEGGTVLDPFLGSGTTAMVAKQNGCKYIGIELNPAYMKLAMKRVRQEVLAFQD